MAMPRTPPIREPTRLHVEIPELSREHPVDRQAYKPKLAPVQAPTAKPAAAGRSRLAPDRLAPDRLAPDRLALGRPAHASPAAPPRAGQTVHCSHSPNRPSMP